MNDYTEIKRILNCLTLNELEYVKDYINVKDSTKDFGEVQIAKNMEEFEDAIRNSKRVNYSFLLKNYNKENPYNIFEVREVKDCVNDVINDIGTTKTEKLVDEIIKEKENKETVEETNKRFIKTKEIMVKDITNVLNDLNIYELGNIKRNLSSLIKAEDKISYFQNCSFFDSDLREYYGIEEIEHYIEIGIINFGIYFIHDLVVDLLQEKEIL